MIYSTGQINVWTDFEINRFRIDEVRKYATIVYFIWRHVTQKRYVVRHVDYDTSDRYFNKEHFENMQKSRFIWFIWRQVTQKRYVMCHGDYDISDRYFDKEHFETNQKSLRLPVQKLWLK